MGLIKWFKGLFSNIFKVFKVFAEKVTDVAIEQGAAYILDVARHAVKELMSTNLSNKSKREEAFKRVRDYAVKEGLDVPESIINKVIEDCVIEYKIKF